MSESPRTAFGRWVRDVDTMCRFHGQLLRLRLERLASSITGRADRPRVIATACWGFPIYSQTFVYQELTQLIRRGFSVRFLYSELTKDALPTQFAPLWNRRRRLRMDPLICARSLAYFSRRMPARVDALVDVLSRASGLSPEAVREHYHVRQAFAFARTVEAYRPSYLHSYFFYEGSLFTLVAAFLLEIPRGVSCYADHLLDDYVLKVVLLHLQQSAITIATSDRIRRELLGVAPTTSPERILVKPNGINTDQFPVVVRPEPASGQPFRLVCLSRIEPKKGLVYLIRAVGLLRDRGMAIEADLIGGVDDSDASRACHRELIDTITALDLTSSVHLVGRKGEAEINQHFAAAHLFVAPFIETSAGDKDGIPTALLEGMASGLPVVVTDAGSMCEVVTDGHDGVIVPQREPETLASAIERLLRDKAQRDAVGRAGAETVRARFDARSCERAFHERLRSLLASPPSDRSTTTGSVRPAI